MNKILLVLYAFCMNANLLLGMELKKMVHEYETQNKKGDNKFVLEPDVYSNSNFFHEEFTISNDLIALLKKDSDSDTDDTHE